MLLFCALGLLACKESNSQERQLAPAARWEMTSLEGWTLYSQDENPDQQIVIENQMMKIWTRQGSVDRKKARTEKIYTTGRYTWKTYISQMGVGDQASIGSWIYCDDHHEIDFEVGYGKAVDRQKYGVKDGEMLAWMTTQDHPFKSTGVPVSVGWHVFELDLSLRDGKYFVQWIIDGKVCSEVQQTFGDQYKFSIYCSVENLKFVGDNVATQDNYGLFDWVEFTPHN